MRPSGLPLLFLEDITNGFSKERILGKGGYGQVYKGVDKNGREIAVKKLHRHMPGLDDDKQFTNELNSLMRVRHRNIVRLVGYCQEIRSEAIEHNGELFLCNIKDRVLCLEYLPGGSLDNHLNDESCGHDWPTRFKIIKGVSEGLSYLHTLKKSIFHLDLKPANILLDKNMIPKIADFGLSRLFGGTHTHVTKNCIGTEAYMPPEYLFKRQISEKNDVFSLGMIIIDIMTGQGGYSRNADMSSQEHIEHVHNNWRKRFESTPMYATLEEDCRQVKRCIELALKCVEGDRHKRPTVDGIIRELRYIETKSSTSPRNKTSRLGKIGPWGGVGGGSRDIEEAPDRLTSLTIGSDHEVIYSLQFSYDDHDGKQRIVGPWGGHGPNGHGRFHRINLSPQEVLTEVYGTIGPANYAPGGVMKSFSIITTSGQYGPFGEVKGAPFKIPVQSNGSIVGFFARAGWCIDALGIYVKPEQETEEAGVAKIGLWGGDGGQPCDIEATPQRVESVTICTSTVINSLAFSYHGHDGRRHTAGPWGTAAGGNARTDTVQLGISEFLTGVHGTTGGFSPASADAIVVTSLTLVTNIRSYGPFGECRGSPFQIPMWGKGSIAGFFGRAEAGLNAVGVYVNSDQEDMEEELVCSREPGFTKIGPWGGGGDEGDTRDINIETGPYRLESVTICCGAVINSLSFSYIDFRGVKHDIGPWGSPVGNSYKIVLEPLELVQGVSGTVGSVFVGGTETKVITSLTFATNHCRAFGPFGGGGGTSFSAAAETDGCVVGFFGRAGSCLQALGVYVHRY